MARVGLGLQWLAVCTVASGAALGLFVGVQWVMDNPFLLVFLALYSPVGFLWAALAGVLWTVALGWVVGDRAARPRRFRWTGALAAGSVVAALFLSRPFLGPNLDWSSPPGSWPYLMYGALWGLTLGLPLGAVQGPLLFGWRWTAAGWCVLSGLAIIAGAYVQASGLQVFAAWPGYGPDYRANVPSLLFSNVLAGLAYGLVTLPAVVGWLSAHGGRHEREAAASEARAAEVPPDLMGAATPRRWRVSRTRPGPCVTPDRETGGS
jgi:hypothetical protein